MGEYIDEGVSGSKESRPELNRLMADAQLRDDFEKHACEEDSSHPVEAGESSSKF